MFILNNAKQDLFYRAHGRVLELKAGLNLVEDGLFTQHELEAHFGHFVRILTEAPEEPEVKEPEVEDETPAEEEKVEEKTEEPAEVKEPEVEDETPAEEEKVEEKKPAKTATKRNTKKSTKK